MQEALVTGGAGFIGSHLVDSLLADGWNVTVIDSFDPFYSPDVKKSNIASHLKNPHYKLIQLDIRNGEEMARQLTGSYDVIVHLAARAGVRPSIANPVEYQEVNVGGTQDLLELARDREIRQFVFASSSSVYGVNPNVPWSEDDHVLMPISPYASTKISGELMGHVYSHLYGIRFLALRFFTVYGPRQRPDLAMHKFAKLMNAGKPIPVFGDGGTRRDYTYVDDIVGGIRSAMAYDKTSYEVINLGNNRTVSLAEMIATLEEALGNKAVIERLPEQPGDVPQTWANIAKAKRLLSYSPETPLLSGLRNLADWLNQHPDEE